MKRCWRKHRLSLPQAGISAYVICALEEAFADPKATYETGILDMEFVERVNVFENYVDADQIADVDEQVAEVTKEKESNKIYVVESGDCLSVIAMDHDTTVSSIVALNGLQRGCDDKGRSGTHHCGAGAGSAASGNKRERSMRRTTWKSRSS